MKWRVDSLVNIKAQTTAVFTIFLPSFLYSSAWLIGFYNRNDHETFPHELFILIFIASTLTLTFSVALSYIHRTSSSALFNFLLTIAFFNYGALAGSNGIFNQLAYPYLFFTILAAGITFLAEQIWKKFPIMESLIKQAQVLYPLILLLLGLITLGSNFFNNLGMYTYKNTEKYDQPITCNESCIRPDIYYLVFDRYASDSTLEDIYGYENELSEFLELSGFTLNQTPYANYQFTPYSLASVLNMRYLDDYFDIPAQDLSILPLYTMIQQSRVGDVFKELGYEYISIGSWWGVTHSISQADINYNEGMYYSIFGKRLSLSDFQQTILRKTPLFKLAVDGVKIGGNEVFMLHKFKGEKGYSGNEHIAHFEYQEHIMQALNDTLRPRFTFAHFLMPHPSYVLDEKCERPDYHPGENSKGLDEDAKYLNQLKCTNKSIKAMINDIINKDPEAVILLQADEGPYPTDFRKYGDYLNAGKQTIKQKLGIQSALRLPQKHEIDDHLESWVPVNSFRIIFNSLFGNDFKLLGTHNYVFNQSDPYNLKEVTNLVNE